MIPNLNPNDLIIFYFVAREKSLSAAADRVFLTQPAITYHIQSLEKYTKVKLLEFKKRQVSLTPYGKELFKYAEEVYRQLTNAELFLRSLKDSNLRVGIASVYDSCISPLLSSMFEEQNPEIKLTIKSGNAFEMVQAVLDSTLDLAIVPRFDYGNDKLNEIQVSYPEKILCFAAASQPAPEVPLGWEDLYNYPLVAGPETSVIRRILFKTYREKGLHEPSLAAEVSNIEWCKSLVANGKGLSFTLYRNIEREIGDRQFKLVPLEEYLFITAAAVTCSDVSSPVIAKFISLVKQAFNYSNTGAGALSAQNNPQKSLNRSRPGI